MKNLLFLMLFSCMPLSAQVTVEGFCDTFGEEYYFYEINGEMLKEPVLLDLSDAPDAYNILKAEPSYRLNSYIKLTGQKTDGGDYDLPEATGKLIVRELLENDENRKQYDFVKANRESIEKIEKVSLEGFHFKALEASYFWPLENGELTGEQAWTMFDKSLQDIDSLQSVSSFCAPGFGRGAYMKIEGVRKSGVSLRYGHRYGVPSQIDVMKIVAVDTARTAFKHIADKLNKDKYFVWYGDTLHTVGIFDIGKTYTYMGQDELFKGVLNMTRVNETDIDYTMSYFGGDKKIKEFNGRLSLHMMYFLTFHRRKEYTVGPACVYESLDKRDTYGRSLFNLTIHDDDSKEGFIIYAEDEYSGLTDYPILQLEMTEKPN